MRASVEQEPTNARAAEAGQLEAHRALETAGLVLKRRLQTAATAASELARHRKRVDEARVRVRALGGAEQEAREPEWLEGTDDLLSFLAVEAEKRTQRLQGRLEAEDRERREKHDRRTKPAIEREKKIAHAVAQLIRHHSDPKHTSEVDRLREQWLRRLDTDERKEVQQRFQRWLVERGGELDDGLDVGEDFPRVF